MKLNTKTFLIYFITNYKYNEQNLILLSNNQDSIENFINEEDYKYLPPEQQLIKLNEDKKLYNNVQRLIKRSREYELPKNEITFESIYPNTQLTNGTGTNTGTDTGTDGTVTNTDNTVTNNEIDIKEIYNKEYEPIRTEYNSKNTLELIPSIVQKPIIPTEDRDELKIDKLFSLGNYTNEEIHENEFYLNEINEKLKQSTTNSTNTIDITDSTDDWTTKDSTKDTTEDSTGVDKMSRWEMYERLNKNKKFVKELRKLKLEKAIKYRKFLRHLREIKKRKKNTFYRMLPINNKGYKLFNNNDIHKFEYEELQEELRNRGYRCSYNKETLINMLKYVNNNEEEWRYEKIVKQELTPENINLSQITRNKLKEIYEMIDILNNTHENDDISIKIKRLEIIFDLIHFYTDPVGYLDLDINEEITKEEMEEIKKAPIIYDTTFFNEMSKPIVRLPDLVPLTFNLQEDFVKKFPITSFTTDRDLESLKKEYLTIEGGIHQQTLPEISERFGVNIDFLGDACCRLGAYVPIDLTKELRGIISYSAIWDLLQFLNICDPAQIELFYTNLSIEKIAKELNITLKLLYKFLDKLCIKLPFGINTRLNLTCLKYLELYTNHYKKKYLSTHESNEYTINGTTTKGIPNTEDISTLGPSTVTKGKGANFTLMECTPGKGATNGTTTNEYTNKSHINE